VPSESSPTLPRAEQAYVVMKNRVIPPIVIPDESPWRSGDWTRRAAVIRYAYPHDGKEESMAVTKAIGKKIAGIESQLKKRVRSLEKDLEGLVRKLEKKEHEVKKLKDKMTSKFVKNVTKKAKKAKKKVTKRLSNIF
jgi:hypothetical protein